MQRDSQLNCAKPCPQKYEDLSFDEWVVLHESDPDRFDTYRQKLLNDCVDSAPEYSKPRLRGLIFQMEAEAIRSKSQLEYNIWLSNMMMDMVAKQARQLNQMIGGTFKYKQKNHPPAQSAILLPFDRPGKMANIKS